MVEDKEQLVGVKGWLLFLVLVLTIIGPARGAWEGYSELGVLLEIEPSLAGTSEYEETVLAAWLGYGVSAFLSICSGLLLAFRYKPSTVWLAIALMWLSGPIFGGLLLIELMYLEVPVGREEWFSVVRPLGSVLIWSAYLLMSRRVKNTYASQRADDIGTFE